MSKKEYYFKSLEEEKAWSEKNILLERISVLEQHNLQLMKHLSILKKDGFTYDQISSKMILCEACGKKLKEEIDEH